MEIADAFSQTYKEMTGNGNMAEGLSFYKDVISVFLKKDPGAILQTEDGQVIQRSAKGAGQNPSEVSGTAKGDGQLMAELTKGELKELAEGLGKAGAQEGFVKSLAAGKVAPQEFLAEVGRLLSGEAEDKSALFSLLDGKAFKHLLKNEMSSQWLMLPEEVGEEQSVDRLYERLNNQMKQLSQALSQAVKGDAPLSRAVANVSNNIDFMNQMNQMFTYVQLPLKMQGREANGELYVYTNKKNLAKKDGTVSALLHLDMEHLGSVDVHVALTDQKVSTKFYLKDDKALDLIAEHIDLLNERLRKRGYSMNAQFLTKEDDTNVMEEILGQNKNISVLSGYSFDARA